MKRIVLSGYYGFRNAGDEAVLAGLVRALRASPGGSAQELAIDALSIDPDQTAREHAVASSHRYRAAPLVRALATCDLLASGGGSLLQDVTSRHSIFYYLGVVRAAQILGKRTMFIAQGIGPLIQPRARRLTAAVARRCDAITVRDSESAALLGQIGVSRPETVVTADPALLLGAEQTDAASARTGDLCVSLRPWTHAADGFAAMVARACGEAVGQSPILSVLMSPDDVAVHAQFADAIDSVFGQSTERPAIRAATWPEAAALAASSSAVVGMRLHALILAAASAVPAVALAYDPKIIAFMRQTRQDDAVWDIRNLDAQGLAGLIRRVWHEREARSARLRSLLPSLRAAAARNAEIALSILRR